jgi:hypothetical protein
MGYQPRKRSPKGAIHHYKKSLNERGKYGKRRRCVSCLIKEETPIATKKEISEATLKRLHTLGRQRFGSSPFNQHFDRWLSNVTAVLNEFKANPNIGVDDQFVNELQQILATITRQLEDIRKNEASLDKEVKNLSDSRYRLKLINDEYAAKINQLNRSKNTQTKRLYIIIDKLKKDQDFVIKMKTGFFRGISNKKREYKEIAIAQELNERQTELELLLLDFNDRQEKFRSEYLKTREPVLEQIKDFQKIVDKSEVDGSLEERWLACEALADSVNAFLERAG